MAGKDRVRRQACTRGMLKLKKSSEPSNATSSRLMRFICATYSLNYRTCRTEAIQEPFVEFSIRCLAVGKEEKMFRGESGINLSPQCWLDRLGGRINGLKLSFSLTQLFFFSSPSAVPFNAAFLCSQTDTCLVQVSSLSRDIQKANEKLGVISKPQPHSPRTWLTAREGPARTRSQLASEKQDPSLNLLEDLCFWLRSFCSSIRCSYGRVVAEMVASKEVTL